MLSTVPKYLSNRPDIRARELVAKGLVYRVDERLFRVAGRNSLYDVFVANNVIQCTCPAGMSMKTCSHALAVGLFIQKEKLSGSSRSS
jgi:hypothetical protein